MKLQSIAKRAIRVRPKYRLRTLVVVTTVLGVTFAYAAQNKQVYDREQAVLNQIDGLTINRPVKHQHLHKLFTQIQQVTNQTTTKPLKRTAANLFSYGAF